MLHYNSASKQFAPIPTKWQECTWKHYLSYLARPDFLNDWGVPSEIYLEYQDIFDDALSFLSTEMLCKEWVVDIQEIEFGKYAEMCMYLIHYSDNIESAYLDLICIFEGAAYPDREARKKELKNESVINKFNLVFHLAKQTIELEKELQEHAIEFKIPKSDEEKLAGVDKLQKWGYYAVIDALANGDLTKHKEIESMKVFEVVGKLKLDTEKSFIKHRVNKEYEIRAKRQLESKKKR